MAKPLQKLIWLHTWEDYLLDGSALLVGPVMRVEDTSEWTTPAQVLAAYGIDAPQVGSVDVLRFEPSPLAQLSIPTPDSPAGVAGFAHGFADGALSGAGLVPVWDLAPTEVPRGAEMWRLFADGRQELVAAFQGPAQGWSANTSLVPSPPETPGLHPGRVPAPPSATVGPQAELRGKTYRASWVDPATLELFSVAEPAPQDFERIRPGLSRQLVPAVLCTRIFEETVSALWTGAGRYEPGRPEAVPCQVLHAAPDGVSVLLSVDAARAASLQAHELEPGVCRKTVPREELAEPRGVQVELGPQPQWWRAMTPRQACDQMDFWAEQPWPLSTEAAQRRLSLTDTIHHVSPESTAFLGDAFALMVREGARRWGRPTMQDGWGAVTGSSTARWKLAGGSRVSFGLQSGVVTATFDTPQGAEQDRRLDEWDGE
ncbi:DUF6301 family protein [Galactobacter caseinivorans]|uniref:Uncharacterized protein n=1 Tax=Galactobacter caseinivorans TaxID=2676123 RepID=A0A496PJX7_9MICC|nr:DUF6301 family protein [Galactobacter caseinivorans]RKW70748.1 hypothetical protein DWQ67_06510 [Galactobacter caseinivorans]